jgi:hypothetical protein
VFQVPEDRAYLAQRGGNLIDLLLIYGIPVLAFYQDAVCFFQGVIGIFISVGSLGSLCIGRLQVFYLAGHIQHLLPDFFFDGSVGIPGLMFFQAVISKEFHLGLGHAGRGKGPHRFYPYFVFTFNDTFMVPLEEIIFSIFCFMGFQPLPRFC